MKRISVFSSPIFLATVVLLGISAVVWGAGAPINHITEIAIYALYGIGVNVLIGYLGLVPFGASLFFGCASYAVALTLGVYVNNELFAIIWSMLFSILLAVAVGAIILRRKGLYFSLITLACSQVAFEVAFKWTDLTGGENGIQNVPRYWFPDATSFHVFTLVVVLTCLWLLWRLAHSPFGRLMQAVRDNDQRITTLGFDTYRVRLVGFCISGAMVGVAGGLLAMLLQGAYADNMNWQHAGDPVLMAALGGVHHFLGPLWGAITFIALEEKLSAVTENWWLIFAPIIILFAILSPEGMQGIAQRWRGRKHWTLTRTAIPARPATIPPFVPAGVKQLDAQTPVLSVTHLSKRFGSIVTQEDISLAVYPNTLHSIIGPNGAGKTTFFNILTGLITPDQGTVMFHGQDITKLKPNRRSRLGLARSFQIISVFPNLSAFENVRLAVQASKGQWLHFWRDAYRDEAVATRTWSVLDAVGLADRAGEVCADLAHGEKRLLEIAISLASNASVLLLDEPLAGLAESDRKVVSELVVKLSRTHTVLLIEHDIDRVLSLSDRITVLHQGKLIADGKPEDVARNPDVVVAYLGKQKDSAPAQAAPAVAVVATPDKPMAAREPLLQLKGVSAGYGGGTVLERIDFTVYPSEVVALLGRNGVGKTTLLRTIMGTLAPAQGEVLLAGQDVSAARADMINRQGVSIVPEGRRLFPNLSVAENLALAARKGGASLEEIYELFPKLKILLRSKAENLSGGERQMVAIARALMAPSKLILLDEPYEGLAPAIVKEVELAVRQLTTKASLVIVEHHAEAVLAMADRAYVLVNGQVAYVGSAAALAADQRLQDKLLGITGA